MSIVTDVILVIHYCADSEKKNIKVINLYLQSKGHFPLEKSDANGGEKVFLPTIYIGAFNCFDIKSFVKIVEQNFSHTDAAFQLFLSEESKYQFKLYAEKIPKWV